MSVVLNKTCQRCQRSHSFYEMGLKLGTPKQTPLLLHANQVLRKLDTEMQASLYTYLFSLSLSILCLGSSLNACRSRCKGM